MRRIKAGIAGGALVAVLVVGASACSKEERGINDAPVDRDLQDESSPFIVTFPDQFENVALKCIGTTLIASHTREAPPVVVDDATLCQEGAPSFEDLVRADSVNG